MLEELKKYYNQETISKILDGLTNRVLTIRVNTLKTTKEQIIKYLKDNNINYEEIDWYKDALISSCNKEDIINTSIYEEGLIYLQSLSSMIPPIILEPKSNETILDMTAAPGSKTSEIASLSNNTSLITATEKNKKRFERLKYNMDKLGVKKINLIYKDARNLDNFYTFDKILLDAPCSGSGTLNNINLFDKELLNRINNVQLELLKKAVEMLSVGGTIIYSTCSILNQENEDIINTILEEYDNIKLEPINKELFNNIEQLPTKEGTLKILPSNYYEGFFVAKLIKTK